MCRWKARQYGLLLGCMVLVAYSGIAVAVTLTISCGAVGEELALCRDGAARYSRLSGDEVRVISTPNSASERLSLYQQMLAAGAADIDVYQIDVIWPGILAPHLLDLKSVADLDTSVYFPAMIANNTVAGRLVAVPWFADAGLLYYRRDLLAKYHEPVPETWQQLTDTAGRIQQAERRAGNKKLWGFVWQGRAYEGLTCNALEWLVSHQGGTIINSQGRVTVDNPGAVTALQLAASWVNTISPAGVLNYTEEESRGVFQSGQAVFMRNWPYAWALLNDKHSPVHDLVGVTALPRGSKGGPAAATLGGWSLAVSKYSRYPEAATRLVMFLAGEQEQKRRALAGAYNPTIRQLYQDPDILAALPFPSRLYDILTSAVARPSTVTGSRYNRVSSEFSRAVHRVITGRESAGRSLSRLNDRLQRIMKK